MKRARLTLLLGTEIPILAFLAFAILPWFWMMLSSIRPERERLVAAEGPGRLSAAVHRGL